MLLFLIAFYSCSKTFFWNFVVTKEGETRLFRIVDSIVCLVVARLAHIFTNGKRIVTACLPCGIETIFPESRIIGLLRFECKIHFPHYENQRNSNVHHCSLASPLSTARNSKFGRSFVDARAKSPTSTRHRKR